MAVRNQDFYNANESRNYPIDDSASGVDNAGNRLPNHVICDLNIKFPETLGSRAYLSGLSVTADAIGVVIVSNSGQPLAAISLTQPVTRYRHYAVEALQEGVGGWIVFGAGVEDTSYNGRFSTYAQTAIMQRCAMAYPALPINGIAKLHSSDELVGVVRLSGGGDLEIVKGENYEIPINGDLENTELRDVIVLRLKTLPNAENSVFDLYKGPCGARPESHSCGEPQPIEFINTVGPNCLGNLTIEFRGCAAVSNVISGGSGIVIDCGRGLSEVCITEDRLPAADGTLPNEYGNLCTDYTDEIVDVSEIEEEEIGSDADYDDTPTPEGPVGLPFLQKFDEQENLLGPYLELLPTSCEPEWVGEETPYEPAVAGDIPPSGTVPAAAPLGALQASGPSCTGREFSLVANGLVDDDWSIINKLCYTSVLLRPGSARLGNAGVLVNYNTEGHRYWEFFLDAADQTLKLYQMQDSTRILLHTEPGSIPDDWHLMAVGVRPATAFTNGALLTCTVSTGEPRATTFSIIRYGVHGMVPVGSFGIVSRLAPTVFGFLQVGHQ